MSNPKRPRDIMRLAKMIGDIATGEIPKKAASNKRRPIQPKATKSRAANK